MLIKKVTPQENAKAIKKLLDLHSDKVAYSIPLHDSIPLSLAAYDDKTYLGGITGDIVWNHLHIHLLAVDDQLQQNGIGSALIDEAERVARERNCQLMIVETMSWQAPLFYQKKGFVTFGEVHGIPLTETTKIYLVKYLR